jgi:phage baseplate assembly protein W
MARRDALFGSDLRLLDDVDRRQSDRDAGHDLAVAGTGAPGSARGTDLDTLSGVGNLQQALLLRFLTPVGDLTALGHSTYGSRLQTLVGELNSDANRNRAKLYVLQALKEEPRVAEVLSVTVTQNRASRTQMDIDVRLRAIENNTPLNLVFAFDLQGGAAS